MNLILKIKSYFLKHDFHLWKDFNPLNYELSFQMTTQEILLDIGNFLKHNLAESGQVSDNRFRLKEETAIRCNSLDELLPLIDKAISSDFSQTSLQSKQYDWNFSYYINAHRSSKDTICIYNALTSNSGAHKNCVYTLASVRKFKGKYYFWNNLD